MGKSRSPKKKVSKPFAKRMRRSSLNKIRKDLDIFTKNNNNFDNNKSLYNEFEMLIEGGNDDDFHLDGSYDNLLAMEDNGANVKTSALHIPEVNVDEEGSEGDFTEYRESTTGSLEQNDDYIAFSQSSSEEEEEEEVVEESEESEDEPGLHTSGFNPQFPWILNHNHTKERQTSQWLTQEIKDFVSYISPSREEIESRNFTIKALRRAVKEIWSDADLHVFGSFATDLYLPGSDIDCVVNSKSGDKEHRQYLYDLARHLKSKKLATHIEVISKARVPIIKFVEPNSNIHIDVSFERLNGVQAAKLIRSWLDITPGLRELVLIVKQFLTARRLNDVHTGGLGGFSIICLVYSFLHLHPKIRTNEIDALDNLGVLLIDFFELYGKNFAYDEVALSFNEDGIPIYIPKSHWKALLPVRNQFSLAIQDPGEPSNNISRSSFNLGVIKKSFAGAFDLLTNKCFEMDKSTFKDRIGKSILGNVIKYKGERRDFKDERDLVKNRAILENELFHKKSMKRSLNDDNVFLDPSDDEMITGGHDDSEMYALDVPLKKSSKKKIMKGTKIKKKMEIIQDKKQREGGSHTKRPLLTKKNSSVDTLMGITDGDSDNDSDSVSYRGTEISSIETTPDHTLALGSSKSVKPNLRRATVDAQTRREYWLSKGRTLASPTLPTSKKSTPYDD